MSFNDFMGHVPFFGSNARKYNIRDIAEEVPFEEINEPGKKSIDKKARAEQISKTILEKTSVLLEESPMAALHATILFSAGAHWADEHPVSDFSTPAERSSAIRKEIHALLDGTTNRDNDNLIFEFLSYALFADGVSWADKHPAPHLK